MGDVFFPLPVPESPPDEGTFFYPAFGAQWLPIIVGKLQELKDPELWSDPPDDLIPQLDELIERLLEANPPVQYPQNAALFPQMAQIVAGDVLTHTVIAQQEFNFVSSQIPANINNQLRYVLLLKAGDYLVRVHGRTFNSAGKVDWYLGSTQVASGQDWYSSSTINAVSKTFTMTVPNDGEYFFESKVSAKHASSSGYALQISAIIIRPNG